MTEIMSAARRNPWQMGGSHAQRDLFFQLCAASAMAQGRKQVLHRVIEDLGGIGLARLEERSSYADAVAALSN